MGWLAPAAVCAFAATVTGVIGGFAVEAVVGKFSTGSALRRGYAPNPAVVVAVVLGIGWGLHKESQGRQQIAECVLEQPAIAERAARQGAAAITRTCQARRARREGGGDLEADPLR